MRPRPAEKTPAPDPRSGRPRRSMGAGLLLATTLALAGCGGDATQQALASSSTEVSAEVSVEATTVPEATTAETTATEAPIVQAVSGNQVDFGDALAQDTVLWFWAPW